MFLGIQDSQFHVLKCFEESSWGLLDFNRDQEAWAEEVIHGAFAFEARESVQES